MVSYQACRRGVFLSRPNRFIALVDLDGKETVCHVKNTGRCRELLVPGCTVILETAANPARKTSYDLIAVYKGNRLINMDSQAPNAVAAEYLTERFPGADIRREVPFLESRLDFSIQGQEAQWFVEVKGCTLEKENIGYFPDAPTLRGIKHVQHLIKAAEMGYRAALLFIIQMEGIAALRPNDETHPAFGAAVRQAAASGVQIWGVDCLVTENTLCYHSAVPIEL